MNSMKHNFSHHLSFIQRTVAMIILGGSVVACGNRPLPVAQISAGDAHSCAFDSLNGVNCWGDDTNGQSTVPGGLLNTRAVSAGTQFSCAISDVAAECWGLNDKGQLNAPASFENAKTISSGFAHSCVLDNHGVTCWGSNDQGQLTGQPALLGPIDVKAGGYHTCALDTEGVKCWGLDNKGQTSVPALTAPTQLVAGGKHNCVLDGGAVICWGDNDHAQLDNIPLVTDLVAISAGAFHTCVVDRAVAGGAVSCWGDSSFTEAMNVRDLTWARAVAIGGGSVNGEVHGCAYHQQGVACWGDNTFNQGVFPGSKHSRVYRSESEIDATPAEVWSVLADLDNVPLWNPFTIAMTSTWEVGAAMAMKVKMSETQVLDQTEFIRVLEPGYKACWGIDNQIARIQSGERCQWLEPLDGGTRTRYVTEDLIAGITLGIVINLYGPSLQSGFDGVALGLKQRAEALFGP